MKLIDANRLRDAVLDLPNCYNGYSDTYDKSLIIGLIDEQITLDAVPVVRCRDCKWWREETDHTCSHHSLVMPMKPSDYCSYGERKTDDE